MGSTRVLLVVLFAMLVALVAADHAHYVDGQHNPDYKHEDGEKHLLDDDVIVRAKIQSCSG